MPKLIDLLKASLPAAYKIDRDLKSGGEGTVFKGTYQNKPAAIKLFKPNSDPKRRDREIECLQQTSCPNLVKVYAVDNVEIQSIQHTLVAYEFHSGGDLTSLISSAAVVPSETLFDLAVQIGEAVESLWSNRIVHRDIKPANIVRKQNGEFVLVDVGLARHIDRSDITALGFAAGTRGYMSPEQALGRRSLTYKSDVFSLGLTLYEIASLEHPFKKQQHLIGSHTPTPLGNIRKDLPVPFSSLVHAMMSVRPASRPAKYVDLFNSLRSK